MPEVEESEYPSGAYDHARRRYLSYTMDFDTRATMLAQVVSEDWEPQTKRFWEANKAKIRDELTAQYGAIGSVQKEENFLAIGSKPFSILAYHNAFFSQARDAFVMGAYYPALVASCALGERILNHLILDLRDDFQSHSLYKSVYRKSSFDDWRTPINALEAWDVLLPDVAAEFRMLQSLRHRSVHFNPSTYGTARADALAAIGHLRAIIDRQFGAHGTQPWFIEGTTGHQFIKKEHETTPFIRRYFAPQMAFVGPLFAIEFSPEMSVSFYDYEDYGSGTWTDEEFKDAYMNRKPEEVVKTPRNMDKMGTPG